MLGFGGQDIVADGFGLFGLVQIAIERSLGERLFNAALRNHFQRMFHGSLQAAAGSRSTEIIFKQILERPLSVRGDSPVSTQDQWIVDNIYPANTVPATAPP